MRVPARGMGAASFAFDLKKAKIERTARSAGRAIIFIVYCILYIVYCTLWLFCMLYNVLCGYHVYCRLGMVSLCIYWGLWEERNV